MNKVQSYQTLKHTFNFYCKCFFYSVLKAEISVLSKVSGYQRDVFNVPQLVKLDKCFNSLGGDLGIKPVTPSIGGIPATLAYMNYGDSVQTFFSDGHSGHWHKGRDAQS